MLASREELKEYCLRMLGKPLVKINIDDRQLEDRLDDAIQYFQQFHQDGIERVFLSHRITSENKINGYIELPSSIAQVRKVIPYQSRESIRFTGDRDFHVRLIDMWSNAYDLGTISEYTMMRSHLTLIDEQINGKPMMTFSVLSGKLYLHTDWKRLSEGQYIVVEAYQIIDPVENTRFYNSEFLKKYATALIKEQWGSNLSKFDNIQLPGGVTMNGEKIYLEAQATLERLREEMKDTYSEPPLPFFG